MWVNTLLDFLGTESQSKKEVKHGERANTKVTEPVTALQQIQLGAGSCEISPEMSIRY